MGAVYTPERKLVRVPFPALIGTLDIMRSTTPLTLTGPRLVTEPEMPENIPLEEGESFSSPPDDFKPISVVPSQSRDEEEESVSSEGSGSSLSETSRSRTPSVQGSAEPEFRAS